MAAHTAGGRRAGLSEQKIEAVGTWWESGLFDARERLTLQLVEGMTATPPNVPDRLFEDLSAQFSVPELVELTAEIAFENFRSRFNRTFAIEAPHQ
ncbi:MAG TPA: hypothetical protein VFB58_11710 [Chloroflexota bacterium]|nr:hypothetical protein [Chloroflexota bacterium]